MHLKGTADAGQLTRTDCWLSIMQKLSGRDSVSVELSSLHQTWPKMFRELQSDLRDLLAGNRTRFSPFCLTLSADILTEVPVARICYSSACKTAHMLSEFPGHGCTLPFALQAPSLQRSRWVSCRLDALQAHWHGLKNAALVDIIQKKVLPLFE